MDGLKIKNDKTASKKLNLLYKCPEQHGPLSNKRNIFGHDSAEFKVV